MPDDEIVQVNFEVENKLIPLEEALGGITISQSWGVKAIAKERDRQVREEGYNPEYDLTHISELAFAAQSYVAAAAHQIKFGEEDSFPQENVPESWPWQSGPQGEWRPYSVVRNLERAGALVAAALDALALRDHGSQDAPFQNEDDPNKTL